MTKAQLKEEIYDIIKESTETEVDFTEASYLAADLMLSSVEVMMLLSDLEDAFDLTIPANQLMDAEKVGDLVDIVTRLLSE